MDLPTTISAVASLLSFGVVAIVTPLVKYIVSTKDKQIEELRHLIEEDNRNRKGSDNRVRELELKVTRFEGEVEMANGVHSRMDRMTEKLESLAREVSGMQSTFNLLAKGRLVSVPSPRGETKEGG